MMMTSAGTRTKILVESLQNRPSSLSLWVYGHVTVIDTPYDP